MNLTDKEKRLKEMNGYDFHHVFTQKVLKKEITVKQYNELFRKWRELQGVAEADGDSIVDTEEEVKKEYWWSNDSIE